LNGVAGSLPPGWTTAPRIWVSAADQQRALEVIRDWEAGHHEDPRETPTEP